MAKYYGVYSCGHEGTVNICGPTKDREWKKEKIFLGLCPKCYQRKLDEERERKAQEAEALSEEMELPVLSGTEKQVKWANSIRIEIINKFYSMAKKINDKELKYTDDFGNIFHVTADILLKCIDNACLEHTDARYWIDNRDFA